MKKRIGATASLMISALIFTAYQASAEPQDVTSRSIIVDHTSLELFDRIPDSYLAAARNMRILFMNRSVGVNTHEALNCLTARDYGSSRPPCRRDFQNVNGMWQLRMHGSSESAPLYIRFRPDQARYDRSRWSFYIFAKDWKEMVIEFIRGLHDRAIPVLAYPGNQPKQLDPLDFDVLSFQFGYLNVMERSNAADFFTRQPGEYDDVYDLEREVSAVLGRANPPRVFVYWTTNLARGIGTEASTKFNDAMRRWCRENGKILFDFADIQAHDMNGKPCFDNRDGVPYTNPAGNASENHPDDGKSYPAICQEHTTEIDGGHLATAQGTISIAKGFWVMAARIAGWNPEAATAPAGFQTNLK